MTISHPHRSLISIAFPALAVTLTFFFGNPLFATNDDAGLAMIGAGFGMAAKPEPHLVFSHYGYGLLLKSLSNLVGARAHGFASLLSVGFSLGLFTYAVGRRADALVISLLIACSCFYATALLEPQFTITASALVASAVACYIASVRRSELSTPLSICIYFAVILGVLIRPTSAVAVIIVSAPVLLWIVFTGAKSERRSISIFTGFLAGVLVLAYGFDWAAYYFSAEWNEVLRYNVARALFNDFQRVPWNPQAPAYRTAGWSHNDYLMFFFWFANHDIYSFKNIASIAKEIATQGPNVSLDHSILWLEKLIMTPQLAVMLVCQTGMAIAFRRAGLVILLLFVGVGCGLLLPALAGRAPHHRILFAITSTGFLCSIALTIATSQPRSHLTKYAISSVLALLSLGSAVTVLQQHRETISRASAYQNDLKKAAPYLSNKVISWGDALVWEWLITPTQISPLLSDITIPSIGALSRTPIMAAALHDIEIQDLSRALCTEQDINIIANDTFIQHLKTFCEEHYQTSPAYRIVHQQAPNTRIYSQRIPEP